MHYYHKRNPWKLAKFALFDPPNFNFMTPEHTKLVYLGEVSDLHVMQPTLIRSEDQQLVILHPVQSRFAPGKAFLNRGSSTIQKKKGKWSLDSCFFLHLFVRGENTKWFLPNCVIASILPLYTSLPSTVNTAHSRSEDPSPKAMCFPSGLKDMLVTKEDLLVKIWKLRISEWSWTFVHHQNRGSSSDLKQS